MSDLREFGGTESTALKQESNIFILSCNDVLKMITVNQRREIIIICFESL